MQFLDGCRFLVVNFLYVDAAAAYVWFDMFRVCNFMKVVNYLLTTRFMCTQMYRTVSVLQRQFVFTCISEKVHNIVILYCVFTFSIRNVNSLCKRYEVCLLCLGFLFCGMCMCVCVCVCMCMCISM